MRAEIDILRSPLDHPNGRLTLGPPMAAPGRFIAAWQLPTDYTVLCTRES
jgi:hypothetical protein